MTYKDFLKVMNNCAITQNYVNSVNVGEDVYTSLSRPNVKYGNITIGITDFNRNVNDAFDTYNIVVYYTDRLLQDDANVNDVFSAANRALVGFAYALSAIDGVEIEGEYSINYFKQSFVDYCAGGYMSLSVMVSLDINECDVEAFLTTPEDLLITKNGCIELNGHYNITVSVPTEGGSTNVILLKDGKVITDDEYALILDNNTVVYATTDTGREPNYSPCGYRANVRGITGLFFDLFKKGTLASNSRVERTYINFEKVENGYKAVFTLNSDVMIVDTTIIKEDSVLTQSEINNLIISKLIILDINGGLFVPMNTLTLDRKSGESIVSENGEIINIKYTIDATNKVNVSRNIIDIKIDAYTKAESDAKYANKEDIPVVPSLDGYATEQWVEDKNYLTEHQDLSEYAKKSDIPTIPTNVSSFNNDAGYLTEHQSLTGYTTTEEVESMISDATPTIVQTTGKSTTDVMSQKAITDSLDTLASQFKPLCYIRYRDEEINLTRVGSFTLSGNSFTDICKYNTSIFSSLLVDSKNIDPRLNLENMLYARENRLYDFKMANYYLSGPDRIRFGNDNEDVLICIFTGYYLDNRIYAKLSMPYYEENDKWYIDIRISDT